MNIKLIEKAEKSHNLSKIELITILKDSSIVDALFEAADRVRKRYIAISPGKIWFVAFNINVSLI